MDHKSSPNNSKRLLALAGFLSAALVIYVGVLYNIQVNQHDYYLAKSIRTITRVETVEASRGVITDRSGRELVSSRSSYNLTFDSSLLSEEDDENLAILSAGRTICPSPPPLPSPIGWTSWMTPSAAASPTFCKRT